MRAFLVDFWRRSRLWLGPAVTAVGLVGLVVPVPTLSGLPLDTISAVVIAFGTVAMSGALWSQHQDLKAKDALIDKRAEIEAALADFRQRLQEGNVVRHQINQWPKIVTTAVGLPERRAQVKTETDRRMAEYRIAVNTWTAACVVTLETHLDHMTPIFQRLIEYGPVPQNLRHLVWLSHLRNEVDQKLDRLTDLQKDLAAHSSRAAIS